MKRVGIVNAIAADAELTRQMFKGYNSAICLESDKDTYEEFLEILAAADERAQFYFTYIKEEGRVVSGTVSVRLTVEGGQYHGIVYAFTDREYRKLGLGRAVIESLLAEFDDEFWFCEVLNQEELSEEELAAEEAFSGVTCEQRERFWQLMGFQKGNFDYANPSFGSEKNSGGIIRYNNLWMRSVKEMILGDDLLAVLRAYFLYEYGGGQPGVRLDLASAYLEKQIAGRMIRLKLSTK